MAIDLFVYGTLMADDTVYALTGRHFRTQPALLPGYERVMSAVGYFFIRSNPGAAVDGVLLLAVDEASLAVFDAYEEEGTLYRRANVTVLVGDQRRACATYVGKDIAGPPAPNKRMAG